MAKNANADSLLEVLAREAFKRDLYQTRTSAKGKQYLTTGMINFSNVRLNWTGDDGVEYSGNVGGQMVVNVIGIQKAAEIVERKAATIEQQFDSLSADEQAALAEKLLARVK